MIFENKEALLNEIAKEKSKSGIPRTLKFYKARHFPNKSMCKLINFNCRYCEARICCRVIEGGKVVVTDIDHKHHHTVAKFTSQAEEEIYRFYLASKAKKRSDGEISKLITRAFSVTPGTCTKLLNRFKEFQLE